MHRVNLALAASFLSACAPQDTWDHYDLYWQIRGDMPYEAGAPVCQVATSSRHAIYVTSDGQPGSGCYFPDDVKGVEFIRNVPAGEVIALVNGDGPDATFNPVHVDGEGLDLVALDAGAGLAWWQTPPYPPEDDPATYDVPVYRGVSRPVAGRLGQFVDVVVSGGVAWIAERYDDGTGALHRVPLADGFGTDAGGATFTPVDAEPIALDAGPDGPVLAVGGPRWGLLTYDRAGAPLGDLDLTVPVDALRVGGNIAWITARQRLYAVDVADPRAAVVVPGDGTPAVDGAAQVMHADGAMVFLASGFDAPSIAWDGAEPQKPRAVGGFHVGNGTFDIDTQGQVLFLAAGSKGLQLWGPPRDWDTGGSP